MIRQSGGEIFLIDAYEGLRYIRFTVEAKGREQMKTNGARGILLWALMLCLPCSLCAEEAPSVTEEIVDGDGKVVGMIDWTQGAIHAKGTGKSQQAAADEACATLYKVLLVVPVDDANSVGDRIRLHAPLSDSLRSFSRKGEVTRTVRTVDGSYTAYVKAAMYGDQGLLKVVLTTPPAASQQTQPTEPTVKRDESNTKPQKLAETPGTAATPVTLAEKPENTTPPHKPTTVATPPEKPAAPTPPTETKLTQPQPATPEQAKSQPAKLEPAPTPATANPADSPPLANPTTTPPAPTLADTKQQTSEEPAKEEPKKEEPKQEEPKKDEPPKAETPPPPAKPDEPATAKPEPPQPAAPAAVPAPTQPVPPAPATPAPLASQPPAAQPPAVTEPAKPEPKPAEPPKTEPATQPAPPAQPAPPPAPAAPALTPLNLPATGPFTGLLIDARGLGLKSCISPRIITEGGKIIYGVMKTLTPAQIEEVGRSGIVGYLRSSDVVLKSRAGARPLGIRALRVEGAFAGIPVISDADGERILSEHAKTKFLDKMAVSFLIAPQ